MTEYMKESHSESLTVGLMVENSVVLREDLKVALLGQEKENK